MELSRTVSFRVLAMSKVDHRTILRRTRLFEIVERRFCHAVCVRKIGDHWSMWSSAVKTAARRNAWEKREGERCCAGTEKTRGAKGTTGP